MSVNRVSQLTAADKLTGLRSSHKSGAAKIAAPLIALCVLLGVFALGTTSALAAAECSSCKPWWHLSSAARPTYLAPGTEAQVALTLFNLGDADASGETTPVRIVDRLPEGLRVVSVRGAAGQGAGNRGPVTCSSSAQQVECSFAGTLPPYDEIEIVVGVQVQPGASSGELEEASVSGGGAPGVQVERSFTVSEEPTPFGLQVNELSLEEEDGTLDTQAGSHPFQVTSTLVFNQTGELAFVGASESGEQPAPHPAELTKSINVKLPPGLVGNPPPIPRCTLGQFLTPVPGAAGGGGFGNACPAQSAVGVAVVTLNDAALSGPVPFTLPLFNLEPSFGEPARFGFYVAVANAPIFLDASVRGGPGTGEEYAVTVSSLNIPQTAGLLSTEITFWGVPGDSRHNDARGWGCLAATRGEFGGLPCEPVEEPHPAAFLTAPTSCTGGPLPSSTEVDAWPQPANFLNVAMTVPLPTLDGCNRLAFSPTIKAEPTADSAASPSGLDFSLSFDDEGLTSAEGVAQSQLKDTTVTLPEGFTINPSAGVGLGGCTPADYAAETVDSAPGAGCPNDSKLGEVTIETPLLSTAIHGAIFIAQPFENQFGEPGHPNGSLVALYVVAKNPETGILIKLAGKVTPNPVTGQLTASFEGNPQLPFDHFNFHFREGQQAPLITPATCGTYTTQAQLTPWSDPATALTDTSSFTITSGSEGSACPSGGVPPFHPQIAAGSLNNNAGAFSPLYIHLTRTDAEQEIAGFSTDLPPGLTGDLTGIPFCPEADVALARTKTGAQEEASPSCPAASQIGHTLVGTGVGAVLAYVPGKIYLAGPYNGDPFSIVAVTSAVVGPFDLGTVVLRFALRIDPYTARVSVDPTASEPIPTIIDGIVTHVRDIRVYIDRNDFTLNPTNCSPMGLSSTLTSNLGQASTVSSSFQAASCANLKFAPKFAVSTSGKTSRANGASLAVKLTYPQGAAGTYANVARVKVDLPKQLPSRLTTLQKACTAAQFEANPAGCPTASFIGHAKAITPLIPVPLEGPAIFVSHGGEAFPSLIMVLQGYGVTIDLVGTTFISKAGITSSTFKTVPDQPIGSFELTLPEGKFSALAANGNLCTSKLAMPTEFLAQNGLKINESTKIGVTGCAKTKALTRAQKLTVALKTCHKDKKAKRAVCEAKAHKQFGSLEKKNKKKK